MLVGDCAESYTLGSWILATESKACGSECRRASWLQNQRLVEVNVAEHLKLFFFSGLFFNWSIVDKQCCVGFRCTAEWFSYTCTYIHSFPYSYYFIIIYMGKESDFFLLFYFLLFLRLNDIPLYTYTKFSLWIHPVMSFRFLFQNTLQSKHN